jgi:8-oxo-dGTP pyrophosphatase MutT (NUDIX family)
MADTLFDSPPPKGPRPSAVRPRDAATLIVVRRDGPKPQLLMGRRHGGHSFMPGKWVFPGGRIDRSDFYVPHTGVLKPETERRLRHGLPAARATALALTAIRETFEETGLLIGKSATTSPRAGPWGPFLAQGALPDLSCLDMVARAVTPPQLPKRFDARFLLAPAEALLSLERQPDCGELDEIAWVDIGEALALELPAITRFVVRDVAERLEKPEKPAFFMRFVGLKSRSSEI